MFSATEARLIFDDAMVTWNSKKFLLKNLRVSIHIKKMKKNLNDRMHDKSGEFFLKPFVSIMHIVFDFRRVQLVGSLKVYGSYWWVLLGSWSVPCGFWSVPGGFWSVPAGFWSVPAGFLF